MADGSVQVDEINKFVIQNMEAGDIPKWLRGFSYEDYSLEDAEQRIIAKKFNPALYHTAAQFAQVQPFCLRRDLANLMERCKSIKRKRSSIMLESTSVPVHGEFSPLVQPQRATEATSVTINTTSEPVASGAEPSAEGEGAGAGGEEGVEEEKKAEEGTEGAGAKPEASGEGGAGAEGAGGGAGAGGDAGEGKKDDQGDGSRIRIELQDLLSAYEDAAYIGWNPLDTVAKCATWSNSDLSTAIAYYIQLSGGYNERKLKKRDKKVKAVLTRLEIKGNLGNGGKETLTLSRVASAHPLQLAYSRHHIFHSGKTLREFIPGRSVVWQDMALMPIAKAAGCMWVDDFIKTHSNLFCKAKTEEALKTAYTQTKQVQDAIPAPPASLVREIVAILGNP